MSRPGGRRYDLDVPPTPSRPIAMVVHAYYEEDQRVRRQAESLVAAGHAVDVFALRRPDTPSEDELNGVRIVRVDVQRHQGAGIATYLLEYVGFFAASLLALTRSHRRRRYGLVQVHSMPDFLVFSALPLRLAGVPVVLDLHEAMPEFFRTRFPGASNPVSYGLLRIQERLSISAADLVLSVNESRHDRLVRLGVSPAKLRVVANGPPLRRFNVSGIPDRPFLADGTLRLAYAGAVTPLYELELVLAAIARLCRERPDLPIVLDVYGRGDTESSLREQAVGLGIGDRIEFHGRVPLDDVAAHLAAHDIALSPLRQTPFSEMSLSTKVFEGSIVGKPVITARTATALRYFPEDHLPYYRPGDLDDFMAVLVRLIDDPVERETRVGRARERSIALSWDNEAPQYIALLEGLSGDGISSTRPGPGEGAASGRGTSEGT
jgi:glycosyltransferase involved in cell wall biosynthesis